MYIILNRIYYNTNTMKTQHKTKTKKPKKQKNKKNKKGQSNKSRAEHTIILYVDTQSISYQLIYNQTENRKQKERKKPK